MHTGADGHRLAEMEPDAELARRTAGVAHGVVAKLQEMGLPESFADDLARLSTDLGDLWGAQATLSAQMESLFQSAHGWEAVGDRLADIGNCIDHIGWHLKSVRRPLGRINRFAYRRAAEQGECGPSPAG